MYRIIDGIGRIVSKTFREDGVIIATVESHDNKTDYYETAIAFNDKSEWRIAKGYTTLQEAMEGHKKYYDMSVKKLNEIS